MNPTIRKFKEDDIFRFVSRDSVLDEKERSLLKYKLRSGPAFTVELGEEILACGGIVILWPGVGTTWMNVSDNISSHKIWFHRTVKRMLLQIISIYKLHRIDAAIRVGIERDEKWAYKLGFTPEGPLNAYGPNKEDYYRFVRLKGV